MAHTIDDIREIVADAVRRKIPLNSVVSLANSSYSEPIDIYFFCQNSVEDGDHRPICVWTKISASSLLTITRDLFLNDIPPQGRTDHTTYYLCCFSGKKIVALNYIDGCHAIAFSARMKEADYA